MKKILIFSTLFFSSFNFAQNNEELKKEIETIKSEISILRKDLNAVKDQNIYLKQVLDINKPILEQQQDGTNYKITKVTGNKADKTITIQLLIESLNESKSSGINNVSIIDLFGNEYFVNQFSSENLLPNLALKVPLNLKFNFDKIIDEPKIIKLLRFSTTNISQENPYNTTLSQQEFRDLNVTWM